MAIDLNSVIANATGVDDLMSALKTESTGAKQASAQLQQLYAAAEGVASSGSWLDRLKGAISPRSAAGTTQYQKEYMDYVTDMQANAETPVSREEFLKKIEEMKATKPKSQS